MPEQTAKRPRSQMATSAIQHKDLERHAAKRYPFTAAALLTELNSEAQLVGRTSDLSLSGCYIDTSSTFPLGTNIRVRLTKGEESFVAMARVASAQPGLGMGIAFTYVGADQNVVLKSWLAELSGDSAPPKAPELPAAAGSPPDAGVQVLCGLLRMLVHKRILTELESAELLHKLLS